MSTLEEKETLTQPENAQETGTFGSGRTAFGTGWLFSAGGGNHPLSA